MERRSGGHCLSGEYRRRSGGQGLSSGVKSLHQLAQEIETGNGCGRPDPKLIEDCDELLFSCSFGQDVQALETMCRSLHPPQSGCLPIGIRYVFCRGRVSGPLQDFGIN